MGYGDTVVFARRQGIIVRPAPFHLTVCTNQRSMIALKTVAGAMRLSRLSLDFQSKRNAWGRDSIRNFRRPHIDEMQRSASKKSLGLRSQSWQDIIQILYDIPRWLASCTEPVIHSRGGGCTVLTEKCENLTITIAQPLGNLLKEWR